jgi:hypothetical protein
MARVHSGTSVIRIGLIVPWHLSIFTFDNVEDYAQLIECVG